MSPSTYSVTATDTGSRGREFPRAPQTAFAALTTNVLACPRETPGTDGGTSACDRLTGGGVTGRYAGTYQCPIFGGGPISFQLVVNDAATPDQRCIDGFCRDLVISPGGGDLSGNWVAFAFQGHLEGGMDCRTGEFRASVTEGQWGLPPANPGDPLVQTGTITGTVTGNHSAGPPQQITGIMALTPNIGLTCPSPFTVERQIP
jgi:hypothetical protein